MKISKKYPPLVTIGVIFMIPPFLFWFNDFYIFFIAPFIYAVMYSMPKWMFITLMTAFPLFTFLCGILAHMYCPKARKNDCKVIILISIVLLFLISWLLSSVQFGY